MDDKSALLGQLKIDRSLQPQSSGGGKWVIAALALVAAYASVAVVVWAYFSLLHRSQEAPAAGG